MASSLDAEIPRIRIAVVDDHPLVRTGTAAALALEADLELVAVGASLSDAEALLRRDDLDVVVLDIRLGTASGLAALGHGHLGRPAVVMLTAFDLPQYAEASLRLGASGFVLKSASVAELVAAIRRVASGGLAFGIKPGTRLTLSDRELEVVRLVVDGRSNDEIGAALGIASKTVETHMRRLFDRLGVLSRTELATRALREGWLELPPSARTK